MRDRPLLKILDRFLGVPLCFLTGAKLRCRGIVKPNVAVTPTQMPPQDLRRILIIKLTAIGDSILAVPAWRALRKHFANAEITLMCSAITWDPVRTFPFLDNLIILDLERHMQRPAMLLDFMKALRSSGFDMVIDFDQWMRTTALLAAATGARYRMGFDTRDQHRRFCYTHVVRPRRNRHEVDNFLDLSAMTGAPRGSRDIALWLSDEDTRWARARLGLDLANHPTFIALHPGCGGAGKPRQWPLQFYVELGNRVTERFENVTLVLTGSVGEKPMVDEIAVGLKKPCIRLAETYSVNQFAALLKECALVVCGNTGAMHIAAAVGTSTVALHGPTNPKKWGPLGENHVVIQSPIACSPCLELGFEYGCTTHPCMQMISVTQVFDAVVAILKQRNGKSGEGNGDAA